MRILLSVLLVVLSACRASAVTIAVGSETFLVETFAIDAAIVDTTPLPLDLTVEARSGNTVYMIGEFDKRLYSVSRTAADATTLTTTEIQAPGSPLFRSDLNGSDIWSFFSFGHEHITSTSDGSVWISQGGNVVYGGLNNNWSRIMRRKLDTTWEAYTLPVDSAASIGFYVDDPPTRMWVMSHGDNSLYYTRLRAWHEGENSATRYPPADNRWTKLRQFGDARRYPTPLGVFPAHLIALRDGRLAGTLYWDSMFFLFNRRTLEFTDVDLTVPPAGATVNSSGPWQIKQAPDGNLWIAEDYAKRVTKYNLATGAQTVFDLTASLSSNEGPHSLTFDGTDVYVTTYPLTSVGDGRLVKITNAGTVTVGTSFATISLAGGLTGIDRDSAGKLWVCLFKQKKIARLTRQ